MNETSQEAEKAIKRFGIVFVATLFVYISFFSGCEMWRLRNGAYTLVFDQDAKGTPLIQVKHRKLLPDGPITFSFPGESAASLGNRPSEISFGKPWTNDTPFGPIVFVDTTVLPGTIALNAFGHGIELLPRRISLDFNEIPWISGTNIVVGTNKPAPEKLLPKNQRWGGR